MRSCSDNSEGCVWTVCIDIFVPILRNLTIACGSLVASTFCILRKYHDSWRDIFKAFFYFTVLRQKCICLCARSIAIFVLIYRNDKIHQWQDYFLHIEKVS